MYQKERMEQILCLLRQYGYVTVQYLTEALHYSKATINRDLILLEQMGQVKRTWGGVELSELHSIPVLFRYEKEKNTKKRLGKRAAEFVQNGDVIFIDGSTTAQYMGEYLLEKKDIHILTNNMALSSYLSEYGINVTVLGGKIVEAPYMLAGIDTIEAVQRYRADKCFFSTYTVSPQGKMAYESDIYFSMHKEMMKNSTSVFYLMDHEKINKAGGRVVLGDFSTVNYVITNYTFSEETKRHYQNTSFVEIDIEK